MNLKALFLTTALCCLSASAWSFGEFRVHAEDLPKGLLQQVRALGLTSEGGPEIPAFQWRLELKRPMRGAREVQEHFFGSRAGPNSGISPTFRYDYPRESDNTSDAVSVRGLVRVSPDDKQIGARVEGLAFPLSAGKAFRIIYKDSGIDLGQSCAVDGKVPASQLNANITGDASRILCEGQGKYKGIDVKMHSTVYFIEALGVFLNTQDIIDSPLGRLKSTTRIVDLKMSTQASGS